MHGIFVANDVGAKGVKLTCVPTAATYEVAERIDGLREGDLFEARLVPWQGRLWFSPAFLFHPRHVCERLEKALGKARKQHATPALQEIAWTMARMASRAEHYPKVAIDTIYDFAKPPPMVERSPLRLGQGRVRSE